MGKFREPRFTGIDGVATRKQAVAKSLAEAAKSEMRVYPLTPSGEQKPKKYLVVEIRPTQLRPELERSEQMTEVWVAVKYPELLTVRFFSTTSPSTSFSSDRPVEGTGNDTSANTPSITKVDFRFSPKQQNGKEVYLCYEVKAEGTITESIAQSAVQSLGSQLDDVQKLHCDCLLTQDRGLAVVLARVDGVGQPQQISAIDGYFVMGLELLSRKN